MRSHHPFIWCFDLTIFFEDVCSRTPQPPMCNWPLCLCARNGCLYHQMYPVWYKCFFFLKKKKHIHTCQLLTRLALHLSTLIVYISPCPPSMQTQNLPTFCAC